MQGTELQERLASLNVPVDAAIEREVQQLVWDYVDDRKAAEWPPERIIVAVKQIAREAGLNPSAVIVQRDGKLTTLDGFLAAVVGWCIDRYYGVSRA